MYVYLYLLGKTARLRPLPLLPHTTFNVQPQSSNDNFLPVIFSGDSSTDVVKVKVVVPVLPASCGIGVSLTIPFLSLLLLLLLLLLPPVPPWLELDDLRIGVSSTTDLLLDLLVVLPVLVLE